MMSVINWVSTLAQYWAK